MDRRAAANFVWYPQPFGVEAEWTIGEGPETRVSYDDQGRGSIRGTIPTASTANSLASIESLHGGYVLFNYKADTDYGTIIPFTRWSYFDGARKFVANSPTQKVNEVDFGVEYQPWPSFEISLVYTHTIERTNTAQSSSGVPTGTIVNGKTSYYTLAKDVDRVTVQLQYNF